MTTSLPASRCPNCGQIGFDPEQGCAACYWEEGEEHFCPSFMDPADWKVRMHPTVGWDVPHEQMRKLYPKKKRSRG